MSKSILSAPHFNDETAAYAWVEARVWPDGRICPHCGVVARAGPLKGKSNRVGLYKCYACRKPFTVKVGTIFEASHIALRDWLVAMHLMASSKKGVSANQLHRTLGITLKSAWFMAHRIREAMKERNPGPLGGEGKIVESDETFLGPPTHIFQTGKGWRIKSGVKERMKALTLVERGGRARSLKVESLTSAEINQALRANVSDDSSLMTDDARHYMSARKDFPKHDTVNHKKGEYVRGEVHTNTVEGYFSIFKRGMKGIYQHCGEQHLQRYLTEFDFRYSNRIALGCDDETRATRALTGVVGRRLTYRTTRGRSQGIAR